METPKIFESEYRFCQILWAHEPVKSRELVALCAEHLGWKPTTTYTVIKRLSERGVLKNENTVVTSLISQDEAQTAEIDELLDKRFDGSLPAFVAAFTKSSHVSDKELDEVQKMIDLYRKENHHGKLAHSGGARAAVCPQKSAEVGHAASLGRGRTAACLPVFD